jgi:hypothetical protein
MIDLAEIAGLAGISAASVDSLLPSHTSSASDC